MKETNLRKWHRTAGMIFVLIIFFQVFSGIVLSVEDLFGEYWGGFMHSVHKGFGMVGDIYRILLGAGLIWMITSGVMIYTKIRMRMKTRHK